MTIQQLLQNAVESALEDHGIEAANSGVLPDAFRVVPCANAKFGDYQWNGALPLAKVLETKPRVLAEEIAALLNADANVSEISEPVEIAGPGFLNFRLKRAFLERMAARVLHDERQGVPAAANTRTVIVDYPSPNVAKPLHVGHVRTTFIGDAIARLLRFAGHHVVGDNHIGDWGTPIGKVIAGWKKFRDEAAFERGPLSEMGRLYKLVNDQCEADPAAMDEARLETAKLQSGDAQNFAIWRTLRDASQREIDALYQRLDIHVDVTLGESFYNDRLAGVIEELQAKGIAIESQGALIIPFQEPPHLRDKPMMIRKSDGSALYATTDLATIQYRMEKWQPAEIVYVVDARQSDHFRQLFEAAKLWGFGDVTLRHITFGTICGEDGRPLRSRSGELINLSDLLDEAERRALEVVREKSAHLPEAQQAEISRVVGIGAVKYADLSQNRTSDYIFSWDKMLAMQGNTAPYLQYAFVRTRSILRKAEGEASGPIVLEHEAERDLVLFLLRFPLAIDTALGDYRLNALSDYLFELAQKFSTFFEACPVLKSDEPLRSSRLQLCRLTGDVLKRGLNLLGIETMEQM